MSNRIFPLISDQTEITVNSATNVTLTATQMKSSYISVVASANITVTVPSASFNGQQVVISNDSGGGYWISVDLASYGESHISDPLVLHAGKNALCVWNGTKWSVVQLGDSSGFSYYPSVYGTTQITAISTTVAMANPASILPGCIINSNPVAAITITLPTGTNIETGLPADWKVASASWDFVVINTSTTAGATVTLSGNTNTTAIGDFGAIPINGGRATFRVVRSSANTYNVFRVA